MDRRDFLQLAAALPLLCHAAPLLADAPAEAPTPAPGPGRSLVLIHLEGGNDGFNTLSPLDAGPLRALRPKLALAQGEALPLNDKVGLHPALAPLLYPWDGKELAILQGVGFGGPPTDHRHAAARWESGGAAAPGQGWLAAALAAISEDALLLHGATLAEEAPGALLGGRWGALHEAARWKQALERRAALTKAAPPALAHLLQVEAPALERRRVLQEWVARAPAPKTRFPASPLGQQLALASAAILSRAPLAALCLTQRGYDTHLRQAPAHAACLQELADALAAFRSEMLRADAWGEVVVVVWSEFGRTAAQNAGGGTDHGGAGPCFVLGGAVQGGLYGAAPSLDLAAPPALDPRRLMATLLRRWWGLRDAPLAADRALEDLPLFAQKT
jgi:uncharacterized protein (DUF1501 family)